MLNINYILAVYLPSLLRQSKMLSLLLSLAAPLRSLATTFENWKQQQTIFVQHNTQVIYLEHLLNEQFGDGINEMVITDGAYIVPIYLSNVADGYTPQYIHNANEDVQNAGTYDTVFVGQNSLIVDETDFFIDIPTALYSTLTAAQLQQIAAYVNRYKLAEYTFEIREI